MELDPHEATILIVDDDPDQVVIIERALERAGFGDLTSTSDSQDAAEIFEGASFDLAIFDLKMPGIDGVQLAKRLRKLRPASETAILILSAVDNDQVVAHMLGQGMADDYVKKPFRPAEFTTRVGMLLARRPLMAAAAGDAVNPTPPHRPNRSEDDALRRTLAAIAGSIGRAVAYREHGGDGDRAQRVATLAREVALELGWKEEEADGLRMATLIHDIGKLAIPEGLLLRRDGLNAKEQALLREQSLVGAKWLTTAAEGEPPPLIARAIAVALGRHEWWDGTGFPHGKRGAEIPIEARIVAVADLLESLLTHFPSETGPRLAGDAGRQFDPEIIDAAQRRLPRLIEARNASSTGEKQTS